MGKYKLTDLTDGAEYDLGTETPESNDMERECLRILNSKYSSKPNVKFEIMDKATGNIVSAKNAHVDIPAFVFDDDGNL